MAPFFLNSVANLEENWTQLCLFGSQCMSDSESSMDNRMRAPRVLVSSYLDEISEHGESHHLHYQQQPQISHANSATTSPATSTCLFIESKTSRANKQHQVQLHQITGPTGSIRGHRDVVRQSLENLRLAKAAKNFSTKNLDSFLLKKSQTLEEESSYLNYLSLEEQGLCVLYTTTLGIVRKTFEDSRKMRAILQLNLIMFEERDIYLNQEYKNQLRLRCNFIKVPSLFVDGQYFGGLRDLEQVNERAQLKQLLAKFKMQSANRDVCNCCGNARFIACQNCHGSQKSRVQRFNGSGKSLMKSHLITLRCTQCEKNGGLVKCPRCFATLAMGS